MIRKMMIAPSLALIAFSALAPATSTPAEAGRKGAKIAAGVILGAAALAIIANSSSARAHPRRRSGYVSRCQRWYHECTERGMDYSCEKFETRGCTE